MRGSVFLLVFLVPVLLLSEASSMGPTKVWLSPFDSLAGAAPRASDGLILEDVLRLVAQKNPSLNALLSRKAASEAGLRQAGAWPNPELEAEIEEAGWDAPGFAESELTISVTQELELFGQRAARKRLARAGIDATMLATRLSAFDLYLETKSRFFALAHAQAELHLADSLVTLTEGIVDNVSRRVEKGAAPQSDLMLARLEFERVKLESAETRMNLRSAQGELASLWGGDAEGTSVFVGEDPDLLSVIQNLSELTELADSNRKAMQLQSETELIEAERQLAIAEARPSISLALGYKRLQADGSSSLVFGIGLPLPLWNRNEGTAANLQAQIQALEYEWQSLRFETLADIHSGTEAVTQLIHRHNALDSSLIPTAVEAYEALRTAYEAGRLPFIDLLEAERSLIELRFARNDVLFAIREEIIALEQITGVILIETSR